MPGATVGTCHALIISRDGLILTQRLMMRDFPRPWRFPTGFSRNLGNLSGVREGFPNTSLVLVEHGYNPFSWSVVNKPSEMDLAWYGYLYGYGYGMGIWGLVGVTFSQYSLQKRYNMLFTHNWCLMLPMECLYIYITTDSKSDKINVEK